MENLNPEPNNHRLQPWLLGLLNQLASSASVDQYRLKRMLPNMSPCPAQARKSNKPCHVVKLPEGWKSASPLNPNFHNQIFTSEFVTHGLRARQNMETQGVSEKFGHRVAMPTAHNANKRSKVQK